jgi:hypothetical protein
MKKITPNEWHKYCVNTRDMWEVVVRCGYYLPKFKSKMITEEYMDNVMREKAWCPKFKDISKIPWPTPPNKRCSSAKVLGLHRPSQLVLARWRGSREAQP